MPTEEELKALDERFRTDTQDEEDHNLVLISSKTRPLQVAQDKDLLRQLTCEISNTTQKDRADTFVDLSLTFPAYEETCNENEDLSSSMGSSTVMSPAAPKVPNPRQSRKRVRNVEEGKTNVKNRLRNTGKSYITRTGNVHRERTVKNDF